MPLFQSGRRRKVVLDKPYQLRWSLAGTLYILATGLLVAAPFAYLIRATNHLLAGYPESLIDHFYRLQRIAYSSALVFLPIIAIIWILFSLRKTHKVAGAIVNITRVIHEFAKGDYSHRVRLRKGDYLQALARALNGMAETLASREKTLNESLRGRIRSAADEVRRSSSLERAQQILTDLQESIETILNESPSYSSLPIDEEPGEEATSGEEHKDAMSGELSYK